jgi:branched-chain amino acid transport system substrate-binding protein
MVEAEGASRSLFTQGYKYLFAVLSTSEQYLASSISLAAEIAEKNGKKASDVKIAMAFENDPFSQDVRAGVADDAKKYGMQVVIDDKLPRDLSDMSTTLTKVRAVKPDLLVVSGHSKGAARPSGGVGALEGRGHGGPPTCGDADQCADGGDYPLRSGQDRFQVR